jgi:hypothetical protein
MLAAIIQIINHSSHIQITKSHSDHIPHIPDIPHNSHIQITKSHSDHIPHIQLLQISQKNYEPHMQNIDITYKAQP